MKVNNKRRTRTILRRIMIPMIAVLFLQAAIFEGVFLRFLVLPETTKNAMAILNERVNNRATDLEREMRNRWSNMSDTENYILTLVKEVLNENGASIADIKTNAGLNAKIMDEAASTIIYLLRKNTVTGAFIILDGAGIAGEDGIGTRSGFYVRDLDPSHFDGGNADLLMEKGLPAISKEMKIPLDSSWRPVFEFTEEEAKPEEKFFFEPLNAARNSTNKDSRNFGYWSSMITMPGDNYPVMTYSIPLIDEETREVFGVIGIDITHSYLMKMLTYEDIGNDRSGTYVLAITDEDQSTYKSVAINAQAYKVKYAGKTIFEAQPSSYEDIYTFEEDDVLSYGSVKRLNLYNQNTPFYSQQWVLIGMREETDLLSFKNKMWWLLVGCNTFTLLVGAIGIYSASRRVSGSIRGLVDDLKETDPSQPVALQKIGIEEIDDLTACIENLSQEVADASSQISKIIDMTNAPIGIYEYKDSDIMVLCSQSMYRIMHWPVKDPYDNYVTKEFFEAEMSQLQQHLFQSSDLIYKIPREDGWQWVQQTILKGDARVLGMLMDVTADMAEKERIAYERDFDSLTDIFNRRAFQCRMNQLFAKKEILKIGALIMCDLDNLKYINDTYGHELGDEYIRSFCTVLSRFQEYNGIIARRSGDEFYVFLHGYDTKEELYQNIMKVWKGLEQMQLILPNGNIYAVRASAGIAWYPQDSDDWEQLVKYADFAMYEVKHHLKGNIREFNAGEYSSNSYLVTGREALDRLLYRQDMKYAFQPVVHIHQNCLYGYEMLMRSWVPELTSASDIFNMARNQSELYQLERVTWFRAMETFIAKAREGKIGSEERVFINSIGSHILTDQDIATFTHLFRDYLQRIVLELTESEQRNEEHTKKKVRILKNWGGMFAIDDFSSGYNSESVLVYLAPEIIKVDMSIIQDIDSDQNRQKLFDNIVSYARTRNIMILAEGVETRAEMEEVIARGADMLQGYYIASPHLEPKGVRQGLFQEIAAIKEKFT